MAAERSGAVPESVTRQREPTTVATAARELRTHLHTGYFVTSTTLVLAALTCVALLHVSVFRELGGTTVGVTGQANAITDPLRRAAENAGEDLRVVRYPDAEGGRADVERGVLDVFVSGSAANLHALTGSGLDDSVRSLLTGVTRSEIVAAKLAEAGADPATAQDDVMAAEIEVETLQPAVASRGERSITALAVVALLVVTLAGGGVVVVRGLARLRGRGAAARQRSFVVATVAGAGLAGALQLVVLGAAALVVAVVTGVAPPSGVAVTTLAWGLVWFGLGWTFYAPVSVLTSPPWSGRPTGLPAALVLLAALGTTMAVSPQPDSPTAFVLSFVPPLSPFAVPIRIATGVAEPIEVVVAAALTLAAAALLARAAKTTLRPAHP
ncbi:ABC transporter permease [Saccharomonospora azurea]